LILYIEKQHDVCARANSIIDLKGFLFLFCLSTDDTDPYDRRIQAALRNGKPRNFQQILSEVRFSYNTLRPNLAQLIDQGLVAKRKRPQQEPGRPGFAYSLAKGVDGRNVSALVDLYKGLVVLSFDELQRICRHEKGGYCKEIRGRCTPQNCPKIIK
jgi:predicted ArsR family transcriptional regulator